MNQQALANLCGVQRTTANAPSADLKQGGAIMYRRSVPRIHDRGVPERYACGRRRSTVDACHDRGLPGWQTTAGSGPVAGPATGMHLSP